MEFADRIGTRPEFPKGMSGRARRRRGAPSRCPGPDRGRGALVDVLPEQEFEEEHLPGAINMPLGLLDRLAPRLERDRGIIVYCYDYQ
jgi:hypothetical protein